MRRMRPFLKFQRLTEVSKMQKLWLSGVYLELTRYTKKLQVNLYALDDFYVEIFFDKKHNEPLYIKEFEELDRLEPYLKQINIDDLFEMKKG